jgi:hypothetical protein
MFFNDYNSVAMVNYPYLFLDTPDISVNKKIGAMERLETLVNHYHGHIYSFAHFFGNSFDPEDLVDYMDKAIDGECEGGCKVCPEPGQCLHECPWNEYPKNDGCVKCPTWCLNGCNIDSSC